MPQRYPSRNLEHRAFFWPMLSLLVLVGVLEWLGTSFDLFQYHTLAYDKVLHFLGGYTCGVFGVFVLKTSEMTRYCDAGAANRRILAVALMAAFSIGMLWEIFQMLFPAMRDASDYDWYDTIGDVIFDMMGGLGAGLFYRTQQ